MTNKPLDDGTTTWAEARAVEFISLAIERNRADEGADGGGRYVLSLATFLLTHLNNDYRFGDLK